MGIEEQLWERCTEKDSPFYRRDYDSLQEWQKKMHDSYKEGKIKKLKSQPLYYPNLDSAKQREKFLEIKRKEDESKPTSQ